MSVHWPIIKALAKHPTRTAVVDDRGRYGGLQILIGALHVADAIESACKTPTVGVMVPTSVAAPMALLAGWMTGRTVVPLNYLLKPDELQFVVNDCGTDTIVTVGPMLDFLEQTPRVRSLIRLDEIQMKAVPPPRWPASNTPDDLACLLYTSGTSGRPKGVMLTHGNLRANVDQILTRVKIDSSDVILGVLPQFHSFGLTVLTLMPLVAGATVVYTARFVPTKIRGLFRDHRPTFFVGIPSMYGALLNLKNAGPDDFSSLVYAVSGGEPLPDAISESFRQRFGVTIAEGYGMTECSPVTNWCLPNEYKRHSVGRPLPGIEQVVVNPETGEQLDAGVDGELRMRGPNIMQGYLGREEETAAALGDDGFLRTGDMARVDPDGHLYITGRIKEMLIVGGENVFPREIEEIINRHPDVLASGVVGLQDNVRGEVPVAFVELVEGGEFDEAGIRALCRENLAGYKVPREIRCVDQLPRNPTGKVLRRELTALLAKNT